MKILNLYCGIGGNRKLWGNEHDITAVEYKSEIAEIYKDYFPNDKVLVEDAHAYLLDHYKEFDFIWSSPPCPSHSQARFVLGVGRGQNEAIYPDMKLYEEILFLQSYFKGKWCVENVIPFYKPLITAQEVGRHLYWANFHIPFLEVEPDDITTGNIKGWEDKLGYDLSKYKGVEKRLVLRNCVTPEVGLHILKASQYEPITALF